MAAAPDPKAQLTEESNKLANTLDADLIVLNYELLPPIDLLFIEMSAKRPPRRNVYLFLTTEGGSADSAYRMMRYLQARYTAVHVVVCGWCKSAGTLMCIGAHNLYMGPAGELGPLDVQIVKADEMDEQKSGLVAEAAFEKLQQESFKFFMQFAQDIGGSGYRVTLKTAFDIATRMTVGVIEPIFDKLDPVTIGEDFRSNRLAQAYAERLGVHSKNLVRTRQFDALENLLSGYPSHGFVIDAKEANTLFRNVHPVRPEMDKLLALLGTDVLLPRSRRQGQGPRMEFMNDDPITAAQSSATTAAGSTGADTLRSASRSRKGSGKRPANTAERSGEKPALVANGAKEGKPGTRRT
ncbi:MAG: hypothetical protein CTY40_10820 [Hyphomicrobium sp.]|nr:MAG: hypothetical protein CTY40_10820 [Hyphomicrobium sp.]